MLAGQHYHYTLNKGSLNPLYSPAPVPHLVSQSHYYSISMVVSLMLLSKKPHCLASCRCPSIDANTSIPEDRHRGPYILVSSTSLMRSLDHLKGVVSSFWVGCVSHAWLQLHYHTVEIRTGYWFFHCLVKYPICHPTLTHWWVYLGPIQFHVLCDI